MMTGSWRRLRWVLALASVVWASVFAVLVHVKVFTRARFDFGVDAAMQVDRVAPDSPLTIGDRILGVEQNGRHTPVPSVFAWLRWLDSASGDPVSLQVQSAESGSPHTVQLNPRRHPWFPKLLYMFLPGLITLLCAVHLARRPDKKPIYPFLVLTTVATYVLVLAYTNLESIAASPALLLQFFAWNVLAPPALVLFFLRTPTPVEWGNWPRAGLLFVPAFLQFVLTVALYVRLLVHPVEDLQNQFLTYTRMALPATNMCYGLAVVILMVRRVRQSHHRRLGLLFLGYGFFLALLTLTSVVFMHSRATAIAQIFGGNDLLMVLFSVLAVSLTVSTSSEWTRRLDRWVHRGFVYGAITVGIVLLYVFISWVISVLLAQLFNLTSRTVTILAAVLATAGLFSVRHIVQDYIDRLFFKTRYRYAETLTELGERLAAIMELPRLLAQFARILGESIGVRFAAVYRHENQRLMRQEVWGDAPDMASTMPFSMHMLRKLRMRNRTQTVFLRSRLEDSPEDREVDALFERLNARAITLLEFQGDLLGVLVLGEDEGSDSFSQDEVDLLTSAGKQAAVAMKNALSYSRILELGTSLSNRTREIERLKSRLEVENVYLQQALMSAARFGDLVGESPPMLEMRAMIEKIAPTDASVVITGESGTGKELVARTIHALSPRAARPLVVVNCAAIPETLLESELFGHVKGAFTGAARRKTGQFELADSSTLFLDEIGEMPLSLQAKLLRVLQEREFHPVGSETAVKVDVRILTATNRDLSAMVAAGTFREDLYYRIHVVPLHLPPLREREKDIDLLSQYFLEFHASRMGKKINGFSRDALERLRSYSWPGNVRELGNVIERAVALTSGEILDDQVVLPEKPHKPPHTVPMPASGDASPPAPEGELDLPYKEAVEAFRRRYIVRVLDRTGQNKSEAARLMGVNRPYLHRLIRELGLSDDPGES